MENFEQYFEKTIPEKDSLKLVKKVEKYFSICISFDSAVEKLL